VVWLTTQSLPSNALGTAPTVGIGLIATICVVGGYPSVIGPRRFSGLSAAPIESRSGDPLAVVTRSSSASGDGLSSEASLRSAQLLLAVTGASTVQITDTKNVLGVADDADLDGAVMREGDTLHPVSSAAIERQETTWTEDPGRLVVATPLRVEQTTVGSLCVTLDEFQPEAISRLEAVAGLLSLYMEVGDFTQQAQLAADARLDALRAQINPHFLFNTLNTIASKSRTDPDEARQLLQRLADFFRYATQQDGQFAEFAHEYFFVRTYLSLEQARFSERLEVHYDIDPQVLPVQVPVLVIQPLIENAVKHGIAPKPNGGTLTLRARLDPLAGSIQIGVRDNGVGIAPELLADLVAGTYKPSSGGVGVRNIHERLEQLYGRRYQFDIRSSPGKGTRIELDLPL